MKEYATRKNIVETDHCKKNTHTERPVSDKAWTFHINATDVRDIWGHYIVSLSLQCLSHLEC